MKLILVTGCAGNTGSYVCELLLKNKDNLVVGIDNFFRGIRANLNNFINNDRFMFLESDIQRITANKFGFVFEVPMSAYIIKPNFRELTYVTSVPAKDVSVVTIKSIEEVYNLAAVVPTKYFYERPDLTYKVNCESAIRLFDNSMKLKVKKFLNASSSEIYGHNAEDAKETNQQVYDSVDTSTRWSYAHGKILTEYYMNYFKEKIYVVHLRYANCYGERDLDENHVLPYILNKFVKGEVAHLNEKPDDYYRSYLYMTDAAEATVACMNNGKSGTAYNVGTRQMISVRELAELCKGVAEGKGYTPQIKYDMPERPGDPHKRVLDITRITEDTGWTPKVNLLKGIENTLEWVINENEK